MEYYKREKRKLPLLSKLRKNYKELKIPGTYSIEYSGVRENITPGSG